MRRPPLAALVALAMAPGLLPAQRPIDLTGAPTATLSEPLTDISHGVELGDGRFLFIDRSEKALQLADLDADRVAMVGTHGAGPNEYRSPYTPIADGKGGAVIADLSLGRHLRIRADGSLAGTLTREALGGISAGSIRGVTPSGQLLYFGQTPEGGRDSLAIFRRDTATGASTILGWWPMIRVTLDAPMKQSDGRTLQSIHSTDGMWPFRTAWVAFPNGAAAIVRPDPYRVDVIAPSGSIRHGAQVKYEAVKVDRAFREMIRAERGPMPDNLFPEVLPPFEGLDDVIGTPDGETWVERMRGAGDDVPRLDVFDATGNRIAVATLRPHTKVVGFGRGTVYLAREDSDDGFWYLERYRR